MQLSQLVFVGSQASLGRIALRLERLPGVSRHVESRLVDGLLSGVERVELVLVRDLVQGGLKPVIGVLGSLPDSFCVLVDALGTQIALPLVEPEVGRDSGRVLQVAKLQGEL